LAIAGLKGLGKLQEITTINLILWTLCVNHYDRNVPNKRLACLSSQKIP